MRRHLGALIPEHAMRPLFSEVPGTHAGSGPQQDQSSEETWVWRGVAASIGPCGSKTWAVSHFQTHGLSPMELLYMHPRTKTCDGVRVASAPEDHAIGLVGLEASFSGCHLGRGFSRSRGAHQQTCIPICVCLAPWVSNIGCRISHMAAKHAKWCHTSCGPLSRGAIGHGWSSKLAIIAQIMML